MDAEKFGAYIAALRKDKNMTQAELGQILQVTDKAVSKWERGLGFPDIKMIEPLADALGVSVLEIMKSEKIENSTITNTDATKIIESSADLVKEQFRQTCKRNILLTLVFFLSFIPMFTSQYGMFKGIQEVSGLINITKPLGFISVIIYLFGVWGDCRNKKLKKRLPYIGMGGVILSELYNLFTWNLGSTAFTEHVEDCFQMVFPTYYVGVIVSVVVIYIYKKVEERI